MKILRVGKMGVGEMGVGKMGQIIGETGVGEMGVGEMGPEIFVVYIPIITLSHVTSHD